MNNALSRFFSRDPEAETTRAVAKERLRLVLVHDRIDMSETLMDQLREDLIDAIGKYMEIDKSGLEVSLSREEDGVALVASIPVKNIRRNA
ncbi:MAG: cell division topological specificity factor MinE [Bacillota bacterium]|nr:cell division topological specificity factor MinE [Bacillota bacterium]